MSSSISIEATHNDRSENIYFQTPLSRAKYSYFLKNIDQFIFKLNELLKNGNIKYFEVFYEMFAQNINLDFMNLNKLKKEEVKGILESAFSSYIDYIDVSVSTVENDIIESVFQEYSRMIFSARELLNIEKHAINNGKVRGIMMEALAISIFGSPQELSDNVFVWDFNVVKDGVLVRYEERETADVYYNDKNVHYLGEVKCRPSGIDESQIDYLTHVSVLIDEEDHEKMILHGSVSEDFDIEKVSFKNKLKDFSVYPTDMIPHLIKKIY